MEVKILDREVDLKQGSRWVYALISDGVNGADIRVHVYDGKPNEGANLVGDPEPYPIWDDRTLDVLDDVRRDYGTEIAIAVGAAAIAHIAGVEVG